MKGVWFGSKHSYNDFGLILTSKDNPLPESKTYTVEIPCSDGSLDLSVGLTDGIMKYNNREITLNFTILNPWNQLESLRSTIANYLHGQIMKVIFDADPDYYYSGRCEITEFKTDSLPATMVITVDAKPYKYKKDVTTVSQTCETGDTEITLTNLQKRVYPTVTADQIISITYGSKIYTISANTATLLSGIPLDAGITTLTVTATETTNVSFEYQECSL